MVVQEDIETYDDESQLHMCDTIVFVVVSSSSPSVSDSDVSGATQRKSFPSSKTPGTILQEFCKVLQIAGRIWVNVK